jgi:hypothetical protein
VQARGRGVARTLHSHRDGLRIIEG